MLQTLESPTRSTRLTVTTTRPTEFIDITALAQSVVREAGLHQGLVNIQSLHTTAAVVLNEHEPLLLDDFDQFLDRLAPKAGAYRHDDEAVRTVNVSPGERPNGFAHCRALVLTPSACLNVIEGQIRLGRWQRLFLVELDGPRRRELSIVTLGTGTGTDPR